MKVFSAVFYKSCFKDVFFNSYSDANGATGSPQTQIKSGYSFYVFFKNLNEYVFLLFQLYYCSSIINFKIKL